MAFPNGVQVAALTFSRPTTFLGVRAGLVEVTIEPTSSVVWRATGDPIEDVTEKVVLGPGEDEGVLAVPAVDQAGFTDLLGNDITGWGYKLTRAAVFGSERRTLVKYWAPVVGQSRVDFDNLPGGEVGPPEVVAPAPVTSVAGYTGAVSSEDLAVSLSPWVEEKLGDLPTIDGVLPAVEEAMRTQDSPVREAVEGVARTTVAEATAGFLEADAASVLFETRANAEVTYQTKTDASETYLPRGEAAQVINGQITPQVQQATAEYLAGDRAVADAAAAAVNANPKIAQIETVVVPKALADAKSYTDRLGISETDSAEWAYTLTDRDGFVIAGVDSKGRWRVLKGSGADSRSDRTQLSVIGDSLVSGHSNGAAWDAADALPARLRAYVPAGVTVDAHGYSGHTSGQINFIMGASEVLVKVPGGTIAASGSTPVSVDQMFGGWENPAGLMGIYGYLSGPGWEVYGNLRRDNGVWSFVRPTGNAPVSASSGIFISERRDYRGKTVIYQPGRNDITKRAVGVERNPVDHVLAMYSQMVDSLAPTTKQILLGGTITRMSDKAGTPLHDEVMQVRERLRYLYPNYFVDLQEYLVKRAMSDMGITPTPADLQAQADYTMPPSLMDDDTHYSRATADAIARYFYAPLLLKKGWI